MGTLSWINKHIRVCISNKLGFTFLELIATMVLMAILAGLFGSGLVAAVQGYDFSRANAQVTQKGHLAMARIVRELTELIDVRDTGPVSSDDVFVVYERIQKDPGGIPHIRRMELRFVEASGNDTGAVYLYTSDPNQADSADTNQNGHILVDGVTDFALTFFRGADPWLPGYDIRLLTAILIRLDLQRPDAPTQSHSFTTLVHPRNTDNVGGGVY
ncbi:PulJ/GspJ family protein [Desulfatitalea alkaliphila]|uniref:Type II secretion system GspH family protein n=1 Tax=Desulfatitalea alkaliphila TaxID=2929485 RepID=A0AA41UR38_9BACT|nr:type II secretion system protein [Desulfatitalea alkaliphila]MCJ8501973.1 type II secretion system GspH family protein [Desulfatitalea alkaliphila]